MRTRNPAGFLGAVFPSNKSPMEESPLNPPCVLCCAAPAAGTGPNTQMPLSEKRRASLFLSSPAFQQAGANNCWLEDAVGSPVSCRIQLSAAPTKRHSSSVTHEHARVELPRDGLERVGITKERGPQRNAISAKPEMGGTNCGRWRCASPHGARGAGLQISPWGLRDVSGTAVGRRRRFLLVLCE